MMMEEALSLFEIDGNDDRILKVNESTLKEIENIPNNYGIITEAIVGPGRIGKSSLLNWLAGKRVFQIGSKTSRVTQGIWIYIDLNHHKQIATIYIDVEGFGDPLKRDVNENDSRLLNIVTQICDVILYNIKGVYDSDMRDKIKLVCNLFQRYRKGNSILEKPVLISVLRDFDLDLPEDPDQEFRNLFQRDFAEIRKTFRDTKAFTLVKPIEGRLVDLTEKLDEELDGEFVQERNKIKKYLEAKSKPLRVSQTVPLSGNLLAENIRRTVKLVNDDDLKMLSKSLPQLLDEMNDKLKKSALATYKAKMEKGWPEKTAEEETLMEFHKKQMNSALQFIKDKCFEISGILEIDEETFRKEIEAQFQEMHEKICKQTQESVCSKIEMKYKQGTYFEDGGADIFSEDFKNAEESFNGLNNLGPAKLQVWESYCTKIAEKKKIIMERKQIKDEQSKITEREKKFEAETSQFKEEKRQWKREIEEAQNRDGIVQNVIQAGLTAGLTGLQILNEGLKARNQLASGAGTTFEPRRFENARSRQGERPQSQVESFEKSSSGARSSSPISSEGARSSSPILSSKESKID